MPMKLALDRAVPEGSKVLVSSRNRYGIFVNKVVQKTSQMGHVYDTVEGEPIELTGASFKMEVKEMNLPEPPQGVSSKQKVNVNVPGILGIDTTTHDPILGSAAVLNQRVATRCGFSSLKELVEHIKGRGLYGDRYAFFDDPEGMKDVLKDIKDFNRERARDKEAQSDYIAAKVHQEEWET